MTIDLIGAGLHLLARAAVQAVAGAVVQVDLSADYLYQDEVGRPIVGHGAVACFGSKSQADRAMAAIADALGTAQADRDALSQALGPHSAASGLPGLAWA